MVCVQRCTLPIIGVCLLKSSLVGLFEMKEPLVHYPWLCPENEPAAQRYVASPLAQLCSQIFNDTICVKQADRCVCEVMSVNQK